MRTMAAMAAGLLAAAMVPLGCGGEEPAGKADSRLGVFVSILPQAYFVRRVGGGHVRVDVLVGPGQGPHSYEPTPKQIARLSKAKLYFMVGVPFEGALLGRLMSEAKGLTLVDTRAGIDLRREEAHDDHDHAHEGEGGEGEAPRARPPGQAEMDPHIWMSPRLVKVMVNTICVSLCQADRAHATDYLKNAADFEAELDRLDGAIAEALAPLKGRTFFVYHAAFGYFADAYGLKQEAVETGGKSPGPRHIQALVTKAKAEGVKVIFVQPQFSQQAARAVAGQIGGAVVAIDPLAYDYVKNLQDVAENVRGALAGERP